ncbi:uncharacterized protein LOC124657226 [Lolium rigidum]|uniref:uncharacterized protein LOC124657226 n=1 Tax=Lolium rigidum TaxID=89674 RepID=UPI001F5DD5F8|nr:uncharacterized protein LOC124657226 [Lolium rigidum]
MLLSRCGSCGTGAYLTAHRRNADGRSAARVSLWPCSHPHSLGVSGSWPLRCSSVHSSETEERRVTKKRSKEEWEALKAEIAHMFQPLVRNLTQICSTRQAFDLEDYQIGMLFGAFLGCVGCYQLWKTAPSTFVDVTLAFLFYKLSIVSSDLRQNRKSNSLTTRLKFGTILFMVLKDIKKSYVLLDAVRMPVFLLYIYAFLFDVAGVKKYGRRALISLVNLLKMRGGLQEIHRIMWSPGYVSPYEDASEWSDVLSA